MSALPSLAARVRSGVLLGAALLAAAFLAPSWGAALVVAGVAVLGLREFYALLEAGRLPSFKVIGALCAVALIAAVWVSYDAPAGRRDRLDWEALALFLGATTIFGRMLFQRDNPRPLETMAGTLMGLFYVGYLLSFYLRLAIAWERAGRWLVVYPIVVVKCADIGAYFIGCRYGRHKLFPRISPAKSWEGTVAGVISGLAASLAFTAIGRGAIGPVRLGWLDAAVLGIVLPVFGLFGDLLESLMKRAAGVKDSGTLIAGMGGILDVIDSLLPAAPLLYFYARFFLAQTP